MHEVTKSRSLDSVDALLHRRKGLLGSSTPRAERGWSPALHNTFAVQAISGWHFFWTHLNLGPKILFGPLSSATLKSKVSQERYKPNQPLGRRPFKSIRTCPGASFFSFSGSSKGKSQGENPRKLGGGSQKGAGRPGEVGAGPSGGVAFGAGPRARGAGAARRLRQGRGGLHADRKELPAAFFGVEGSPTTSSLTHGHKTLKVCFPLCIPEAIWQWVKTNGIPFWGR